jgi:hypothetical protein
MSGWNIAKIIGGVIGVGVVSLAAWLLLTGRVGPLKAAEDRAAREQVQREIQGAQWRQNLQSPFKAVGLP